MMYVKINTLTGEKLSKPELRDGRSYVAGKNVAWVPMVPDDRPTPKDGERIKNATYGPSPMPFDPNKTVWKAIKWNYETIPEKELAQDALSKSENPVQIMRTVEDLYDAVKAAGVDIDTHLPKTSKDRISDRKSNRVKLGK